MNTLHPLPENSTQMLENNYITDDWNITETSLPTDVASFDGKIIARMPDLSSNDCIKTIEKPKYSSVWTRIFQSVKSIKNGKMLDHILHSVGDRQQFFQRVTVFGCAFLLCGVGIVFWENDNDEMPEQKVNVADILSESTPSPASDNLSIPASQSAFSPIVVQESKGTSTVYSDSDVKIPVADIAAVQDSVVHSAEQAAWNRPVADVYSPWNVAPKQPQEKVLLVSEVPAAAGSPPTAVASPPMVAQNNPSGTVEMAPMTPLSMPISPYEQQLFVAQSHPPVRQPVDPFIQSTVQSSGLPVSGMVPTHGRIENSVNFPQQNVQYSQQQQSPTYLPPQQNPSVMPQGRMPMPTVPQNGNQHGQYGQYDQYAVPPNVAVSSNMPIPSGLSTLPPQQNGYYQRPAEAVPMQNNNFHPNAAPAYRRFY